MIALPRRKFLTLAAGLIAAPGLLMPVKALDPALLKPARKMVRVTAMRLLRPMTPEFGFPSVFLDEKPCAVADATTPHIPGRSYTIKGFPMENVTMQGFYEEDLGRVDMETVSFDTWDGQYVRSPDYIGSAFTIGEGTICPPGRFVALKVEDVA